MDASAITAAAGVGLGILGALLRLGHLSGVQAEQIKGVRDDVNNLRKTVDRMVWERRKTGEQPL